MKPSVERLVYSVPEAARALGCSRSLLYDLIKADKFPHVHLSEKRIVIPRAAVEAYLAERCEGNSNSHQVKKEAPVVLTS